MNMNHKLGYKYNAVDIHSHILPGCDDGAESIREAVALLQADREEGIRDVIATSHYGKENGYAPRPERIREAFKQVKEEAGKSQRLGVRLYLGEEVYCADDVMERLHNQEALTINDTCYVLVEFLEYGDYSETGEIILNRLKNIMKGKYHYKAILAHAERYKALQDNRDYLKKIQDLGVLMQVNAYDLALNQNQKTRETAQWLAQERMISFIGSDMHGFSPKREPKMRAGIDWLYDHTDTEYADCVVRKNAEKILRIQKYEPWEDYDFFMSPKLALFFEERLDGKVVRCQVFPGMAPENHRVNRTVVELEDGRAYAIVDGIMGPRIYRMEAYADDSNSYFGCDDTGWYWKWKGSNKNVELTNLGGVEWED